MRNFKAEIKEILTAVKKASDIVRKELKTLPEGGIMSTKINGKPGQVKVTYDENGKRNRKVITKDAAQVNGLLRRELLEIEHADLENAVAVLEEALAKLPEGGLELDLLKLLSRHKELSQAQIEQILVPAEAAAWEARPYEHYSKYADKKTQVTSRGLHVRSKSEVLIAEALYDAGIPFRYEQVLSIGPDEYAPDFTILRDDGRIIFWEHCGRMFEQRYFDSHFRKLRAYYGAGVVPWKNLILTYDSLEGDIDLREVKAQIDLRILNV